MFFPFLRYIYIYIIYMYPKRAKMFKAKSTACTCQRRCFTTHAILLLYSGDITVLVLHYPCQLQRERHLYLEYVISVQVLVLAMNLMHLC